MYFYIDESGNSGLNLFDVGQPNLYYGILSSEFNLDDVAKKDIIALKNKLSVTELHANNLGNKELVRIINELEEIHNKYKINFDFCSLKKEDFAIISFFDQVFDQGVNPAVPWTAYWTPLRYPLLLIVSTLFDRNLAKRAWETRININSEQAQQELINICETLLCKINSLSDERSIEIILDAIKWVIKNPSVIGYNVYSKENKLQISPNIISFQTAIFTICHRLTMKKMKVEKITVDIQSEFNKAQDWITKLYQNIRNNTDAPLQIAPHMPSMDLSIMPLIDIDYKSSEDSIGLQLVDIYLWICQRLYENKKLAKPLIEFFANKCEDILFDEISLASISQRWSKWFSDLPEPSELELEKGRMFGQLVEERRKPFVIK
ncbi:DUF3800 domain-containing protein [Conservatibacter flavescens]|uniref:DUF3800 domain-containing protein n=1 Tax=Conservatibacter flavescens TaxID=28161 RepID=A0A2M8S0V0_9PAST|nr:DUF3800 domain-containing protein [Conservatibacter flavescens]PJG84782.1 hypothetical protein CVP05_09600 [Conservatibacter flavescens]